MSKIPNTTIQKVLVRQIKRLEKISAGHSFAYADGELEYLIKVLKQIQIEYKDQSYLGKPIGQSMIDFQRSIGNQGGIFNTEPS
jgi:hypothetical protein